MALNRDAYRAVESVLGPDNLSEDPAVLLGYSFGTWGIYPETGKFMPIMPAAVGLPGSTEECRRIMAICRRHKIKCKAHSTGYGPWCFAGVDGVLVLDLRRMNQILEIDEKNMYAVIEPYVTAIQLQVEIMKRGMDCPITGAGANHSPLASATAFFGMGPKSASTSHNERNVLGVEWILPTGEILRLGAPGSGCGWFSGDGPGPSLRGIMRGYVGNCGGLGIFTKLALKLYPWPGSREVESTGIHPQIGMACGETVRYYHPYWESWEDFTTATYKISEAAVAYIVTRKPPDAVNTYLTRTNNEFYELLQQKELPFPREHSMGMDIVIAAHSQNEFNYKIRVLQKIVKETAGKFLAVTPEHEAILLNALIRLPYIARVFRPTGDVLTSYGIEESIGLIAKTTGDAEELMRDAVQAGKIYDFGKETFWGWTYEQGRQIHWENAYAFDPTDIESRRTAFDCVMKSANRVLENGLGLPVLPGLMGPFADMFGPQFTNAQVWMRKVKNAFDPDNSSDHSFYISPEAP